MNEQHRYETALRTLYLSDNKLASFTDTVRSLAGQSTTGTTFSRLPDLQSLDLRGNDFMERLATVFAQTGQIMLESCIASSIKRVNRCKRVEEVPTEVKIKVANLARQVIGGNCTDSKLFLLWQ